MDRYRPALALIGALLTIGGYVLVGYNIVKLLGLPVWGWQAIGATLFLGMIGAIVYDRVPQKYREDEQVVDDRNEPDSLSATPLPVEFYSTQRAMDNDRGGLTNELEDIRHGWVAWSSGHYFARQPPHLWKGLDRMLLWRPGNPLVEERSEALGEDPRRVVETINDATQKALRAGIKVRRTKAPVLNCVIHDPEAEDAWARVQVQLRWLRSGEWPNFVIHKSKNSTLFGNIVKAYETQWERARPIYHTSDEAIVDRLESFTEEGQNLITRHWPSPDLNEAQRNYRDWVSNVVSYLENEADQDAVEAFGGHLAFEPPKVLTLNEDNLRQRLEDRLTRLRRVINRYSSD